MNTFENLNATQRAAVEHTEGPLLILAGAGSGKTRVLTQRIAHLLQSGKARPWQVMAVTFTNKAAGELRTRLEQAVGGSARDVMVGTFHSICVRLLRREWRSIGRENFTIYDDDDQASVIKSVMQALQLPERQISVGAVRGAISRAKNELIGPERFEPTTHFEELVRRIYESYQRKLREHNALDFDDLIMQTVLYLQRYPERARALSERYRYISVDEYQDTNHAQYVLVNLLAAEHHNLCVVGDDDQCLPTGTLIDTPCGRRPIEQLQIGDRVCGTGGSTSLVAGTITHVHQARRLGYLYRIETLDGHIVRGTEHHIVPARLPRLQAKYYVYLMYRAEYGFRIGLTVSSRRTRLSLRGDGSYEEDHGYLVRCNQEHADKLWVLRIVDSFAEARFWEEYYSLQYGIPTMVFWSAGKTGLARDQAWIKRLYAVIDSRAAAQRLMAELGIHPAYPHHRPQSTRRRPTLNLTMFGDPRASQRAGTGMHRIQFDTRDPEVAERLRSAGYPLHSYRTGHWRLGVTRTSYREAYSIARSMAECANLELHCRMRIGEETYAYTPLAHLHPGMCVLVEQRGCLVEQSIAHVAKEAYDGLVYDLEVDGTHSYVADGCLVHNSIYGWRGADIRNILDFEKDYPDATVIKLEQNYRSTQTILDAAHAVVSLNRSRKPKRLWTENGAGVPVHRYVAEDETHEALWIANEIRRLQHRDGARLRDCAVLYRTNAQSRTLEEAFLREGMPYTLIGGVRFYERREVKDVLAYLRFIDNPLDELSLGRIINVPPRKLGPAVVNGLRGWSAEHHLSLYQALDRAEEITDLPAAGKRALVGFSELIQQLRQLSGTINVLDFIDLLLEASGYAAHVRDGSDEGDERWANVQELRSLATQYAAMEPREGLAALLENVALVADTDKLPDAIDVEDAGRSPDRVMLITLHAAKGLEFPIVFIAGLEEGLFPHSRSLDDPRQMEEERRLAYVGITRAKRHLYLVSAQRRTVFGNVQRNLPSRFVEDIPTELVADVRKGGARAAGRTAGSGLQPIAAGTGVAPWHEHDGHQVQEPVAPRFVPGERVRHSIFGVGTVLSSEIEGETEIVVVRFTGARGTPVDKKLDTAFARLESL
jgi:DNA helicase-2/ATP-dependent DNA helicase PcrA